MILVVIMKDCVWLSVDWIDANCIVILSVFVSVLYFVDFVINASLIKIDMIVTALLSFRYNCNGVNKNHP